MEHIAEANNYILVNVRTETFFESVSSIKKRTFEVAMERCIIYTIYC